MIDVTEIRKECHCTDEHFVEIVNRALQCFAPPWRYQVVKDGDRVCVTTT